MEGDYKNSGGTYPTGGSPPQPSRTITGGPGYAGGPASADPEDLGQPQMTPTRPEPQPGGRAEAPGAA